MTHKNQTSGVPTRRDFVKTSALATAAMTAELAIRSGVHAAGSGVLRVGLIGCGGRGTGAATQALHADKQVKLVALADAFEDRLQSSLAQLKKDEEIAAK